MKNLTSYRQICRNFFMLSIRYTCRILMKHELSREIFEEKKISNIKFHQNPSFVPCGQTDRQPDMKKLIAAFRNFANFA